MIGILHLKFKFQSAFKHADFLLILRSWVRISAKEGCFGPFSNSVQQAFVLYNYTVLFYARLAEVGTIMSNITQNSLPQFENYL